MKVKFSFLILLICLAVSAIAQRRKRPVNTNDTISSNYVPADLFAPQFYTQKGNEVHSANGAPGPKYWQNRVDYKINAAIDTVVKTLTATEKVTYINNSPDALPYLWLQLDQNTYKKDARSNYATAFSPGPRQHTDGYQIESIIIDNGKASGKADFIINDTRMQIRLPAPLSPNWGRYQLY